MRPSGGKSGRCLFNAQRDGAKHPGYCAGHQADPSGPCDYEVMGRHQREYGIVIQEGDGTPEGTTLVRYFLPAPRTPAVLRAPTGSFAIRGARRPDGTIRVDSGDLVPGMAGIKPPERSVVYTDIERVARERLAEQGYDGLREALAGPPIPIRTETMKGGRIEQLPEALAGLGYIPPDDPAFVSHYRKPVQRKAHPLPPGPRLLGEPDYIGPTVRLSNKGCPRYYSAAPWEDPDASEAPAKRCGCPKGACWYDAQLERRGRVQRALNLDAWLALIGGQAIEEEADR